MEEDLNRIICVFIKRDYHPTFVVNIYEKEEFKIFKEIVADKIGLNPDEFSLSTYTKNLDYLHNHYKINTIDEMNILNDTTIQFKFNTNLRATI